MDSAHQTIKNQIDLIEHQIYELQQKKGSYEPQARSFYRDSQFKELAIKNETEKLVANFLNGKISNKDLSEKTNELKNKKSKDDEEAKKKEEKLNHTKSDQQLDLEIEPLKQKVAKLWNEYWDIPFEMEPLIVKPIVKYEALNGTTLKASKDSGKFWLYNSDSEYAENFKVEINEKNEPFRVSGVFFNSQGHPCKFIQDVKIVSF